MKKINHVLISVFNKGGLEPLLDVLANNNVQFIATGGTQQFIEQRGYPVKSVESMTGYPSILGGRVKTLHPAIFGGILSRRHLAEDAEQTRQHAITPIDMVIVDLYPVEDTIAQNQSREDVIEKIDIGGITLIRAAAKNYRDVLTVASRTQYPEVEQLLRSTKGRSDIRDRERFATRAFNISMQYDGVIQHYFAGMDSRMGPSMVPAPGKVLRYGENPHQQGTYYGNLNDLFDVLQGNELSYNNLVDIDAAIDLMNEFEPNHTLFIIIKHTNACGVAKGTSVVDAYRKALAADPLSAFGGVLATNQPVDKDAAAAIGKLFFDVLIAPEFTPEALALLQAKKKAKILRQKQPVAIKYRIKTILNGVLEQDADARQGGYPHLTTVTKRHPSATEQEAMLFANSVVKHIKSNAIVLSTKDQMIAAGTGQTARVDALKQAIAKAQHFRFDLDRAVMASDAFFPFPDCVEIAHNAGIKAIIQPGGSIRDQDSIHCCDEHDMAMVVTGMRHFKH